MLISEAEGGIGRLYHGIGFTLATTSLARFGEMGANTGALALLGPSVPMGVRTMLGSAVSVAFRAAITPFDTLKTTMQVEGPRATSLLKHKVATSGISVLWHGAVAASLANFVGTYPWLYATGDRTRGLSIRALLLLTSRVRCAA